MSDQNLPAELPNFQPDFTEKDRQDLAQFKNDGLPGIGKITSDEEKRMKELYMAGYTYSAISVETRHKKVYILAVADKNKWYEEKVKQISAMADSLSHRKDIFSSKNEHFIIDICDTIREYYLDVVQQFKSSRDPSVFASIDPKLLNLYLRCTETLSNIGSGKPKDPSPSQTLVNVQGNLNVGEGNSDSKTDDLGKVLKALADLNRAKDVK